MRASRFTPLLCVVASTLLATCTREAPRGAPSTTPDDPVASSPASPEPEPSARPGSLGQLCHPDAPCDSGLTCVTPCGDVAIGPHVPDECEPSTVSFCDAPTQPRVLAPEELMLVLSASGLHGVLGRPDDAYVLTDGKVRALAKDDEVIVAGRPAPEALVPPEARALLGQRFTVMGASGPACTAELVGFSLVGLEPREASPQDIRDRVKVGKVVDEEVLFYARQNHAVYITADLQPEGDCPGAVWARAERLPPVAVASAQPPSEAESEATLEAFNALGPAQVNVERMRSISGDPTAHAWTSHEPDGGFGPEVAAFELGGERHLVTAVRVDGWCGDYGAALMTDASADAPQQPRAMSWTSAVQPQLAFDLDGDGLLEVIAHQGTSAWLWSTTVLAPMGFAPAVASTGC